jgi:hypothetical protein
MRPKDFRAHGLAAINRASAFRGGATTHNAAPRISSPSPGPMDAQDGRSRGGRLAYSANRDHRADTQR